MSILYFTRALGGIAAALAVSASQAELTVLQVTPLNGPYGGVGWHTEVGTQIGLAEANARGGIAGQKLRLVSVNQELGDIARQVKTLAEQNKAIALTGFIGDDTVRRLADSHVLDESDLVLVGARSGTAQLGASHRIFLTRASFEFETAQILKQLATTGVTSIGLVHENDAYGREVLANAQKHASANKLRLIPASYLAGSAQVDGAVSAMLRSSPQAIVLASQTAGAAAFIQRYRAQNGSAQLVALSLVEGGHLAKIIGKQAAHGVGVVEVAPNTLNESVPLVREFRAAYRKFGPSDVEPSQAMMEAYVASRVLVEGLRRANGSKARLPAALAAIDNLNLGGLRVSFAGNRRSGVEMGELAVIDRNGKLLR